MKTATAAPLQLQENISSLILWTRSLESPRGLKMSPHTPLPLQADAARLSSRCTSCCSRWASDRRWWARSGPRTTRFPGLPGWAASPRPCPCGPGRSGRRQSSPGRRSTAAWWWSSVLCICGGSRRWFNSSEMMPVSQVNMLWQCNNLG